MVEDSKCHDGCGRRSGRELPGESQVLHISLSRYDRHPLRVRVPLPDPVRRRPCHLYNPSRLREHTRHMSSRGARIRRGPQQLFLDVLQGGLHIVGTTLPPDSRKLHPPAIPRVVQGNISYSSSVITIVFKVDFRFDLLFSIH